MCNSAPRPSTPKFNDPRLKDPKYRRVATKLGITNFNSASDIYQVESHIAKNKERRYQETLTQMEQANAATRAEDVARAEAQFNEMNKIQQEQFDLSMAAQEQALQAQLDAQERLQKRSEEASLRAQVPQLTSNSSNARRVKSRTSSKKLAAQQARGASQLRIPLSIRSGSSSPVKLNIGS